MVSIRLKMGKKGYIIIPKVLREKYGFRENEYVLVELREDGLLIKPAPGADELRRYFKEHVKRLKEINAISPKPGELKNVCLEEEFE